MVKLPGELGVTINPNVIRGTVPQENTGILGGVAQGIGAVGEAAGNITSDIMQRLGRQQAITDGALIAENESTFRREASLLYENMTREQDISEPTVVAEYQSQIGQLRQDLISNFSGTGTAIAREKLNTSLVGISQTATTNAEIASIEALGERHTKNFRNEVQRIGRDVYATGNFGKGMEGAMAFLKEIQNYQTPEEEAASIEYLTRELSRETINGMSARGEVSAAIELINSPALTFAYNSEERLALTNTVLNARDKADLREQKNLEDFQTANTRSAMLGIVSGDVTRADLNQMLSEQKIDIAQFENLLAFSQKETIDFEDSREALLFRKRIFDGDETREELEAALLNSDELNSTSKINLLALIQQNQEPIMNNPAVKRALLAVDNAVGERTGFGFMDRGNTAKNLSATQFFIDEVIRLGNDVLIGKTLRDLQEEIIDKYGYNKEPVPDELITLGYITDNYNAPEEMGNYLNFQDSDTAEIMKSKYYDALEDLLEDEELTEEQYLEQNGIIEEWEAFLMGVHSPTFINFDANGGTE
jgi:hypothetical protein